MKQGILLVAFGVSGQQGEGALKPFDARVRERFPAVPVRWAFTSELARERMARERVKSDSVLKALQKMWFEKFTHVAVQPLQTIPGAEHCDVQAAVAAMRGGPSGFAAIAAGEPLLASEDDLAAVARAVFRHIPVERAPEDAVVLMGHGAKHAAQARYQALSARVRAQDARVFVGTMDGEPGLEAILPQLVPGQRVWLMPLLSLVGRHAREDMAGDAPGSWRSRLEAAGCPCVPVLKGTAELEGFVDVWLEHLALAYGHIRHEVQRHG